MNWSLVILLFVCALLLSCGPNDNTFIPIPGPRGLSGDQGNSGDKGDKGDQGNQGVQGPVGPGATPLPPAPEQTTLVKLCADDSSTFPEYGLCIDEELYAVYWSGSYAFLAKIIVGNYMSTNGTGCHFTVSANCEVTK